MVEWPGGISHLPSIICAAVSSATEADGVSEAFQLTKSGVFALVLFLL